MGLKHSLIALTLLTPAAALADDGFFKDKQIRLVVGSAAGAGYDINARLLARHWVNFIPGTPNMVVQNVIGAGSVIMANQIYNTAPKDGSTIGAAINGMPTAALFTPEVVQYDPRKFIWIGSTNRDTQISYAWHTAPVKTLADRLRPNLSSARRAPAPPNMIIRSWRQSSLASSSRSSPATRARPTSTLPWSAAKCRAWAPTHG